MSTGTLSTLSDRLRTSLSRTKAFGDWGIDLARIHYNELPPPADGAKYTRAELDGYRPYALVFTPVDGAIQQVSDWAFGGFAVSGMLEVLIVKGLTNTELDSGTTAVIRDFEDKLSRVVQSNDDVNPGLVELLQADPGANFNFRQAQIPGAQRSDKAEEQRIGAEVFGMIRLQWGWTGQGAT